MEETKDILKRYDEEVRRNPASRKGVEVVRDANVIRLDGAYHFMSYWQFPEEEARDVVRRQADHFREIGEDLMWRVFDHDQPGNLEDCLEREGFVASPQGSLMVFPLSGREGEEVDRDIRRVTTTAGLKDFLAVAASAFGESDGAGYHHFHQMLSEPDIELLCGYLDGEPVVSGRLHLQADSSFGVLFGGGVSPAFRSRGFYRALVHARASIARQRGVKYLITEARETSRPILERMGFQTLARERTWVLPAGK